MKKFVFACLLLLVASVAVAQTTRKVPYPVGPQTYLGFDHDKVNTETYGLRIDGGERTVITPVEVGPAGTAGWFAFEVPFPALTPGQHLLVGSLRLLKKTYKGNTNKRPNIVLAVAFPIILRIVLIGVIFFMILPENQMTLPILFIITPDLGIFALLILLLSFGWTFTSVIVLRFIWARRSPRST